MIYIDPPYNTGNDFIYNDDFKQTRRSYETEAGITDDEGNVVRDDGLRANTGGHKHSNWLNMMYPRLFLARNLLRQDGVIFVSIDDNEVHNLRLMSSQASGTGTAAWTRARLGRFRGLLFAPENRAKHASRGPRRAGALRPCKYPALRRAASEPSGPLRLPRFCLLRPDAEPAASGAAAPPAPRQSAPISANFAPGLIAAKPVKPCDGGVDGRAHV